jgi:hypothetical protein
MPSKYTGVNWSIQAKAWCARILLDSKVIDLGNYTNEEDAAIAYDSAAKFLGGLRRKPNFPERNIEARSPEELRTSAKQKRRQERNPKSQYQGVFPLFGRYMAKIHRNGRTFCCGLWNTPKEAAEAYDMASKFFDSKAINFSDNELIATPPSVLNKCACLVSYRKSRGLRLCPKCGDQRIARRTQSPICKNCIQSRHEYLAECKKTSKDRRKANQVAYWNRVRSNPARLREVLDRIAIRGSERRVRKMNNGGTFTITEWRSLLSRCGNKCLRCGRSDRKLTADHVVPVSKGGSNYISNIQPLCLSCNSTKHDSIIDYRPWTMDLDDIGLTA